MILVGITGSIGSGKSTFAEFLSEQTDRHIHFESGQLIAEIANEFRKNSSQSPVSSDIDGINYWLRQLPPIVEQVTHKPLDYKQLVITPTKLKEAPANYAKLLEYLDYMATNPKYLDSQITDENKDLFRSLLQWIGGYLVKIIGSGVWYDELIRRAQHTPNIELATIGGVRFPGEARRVVSAGGSVISINRPSIDTKDPNEITERERGLIVPDTTIINDAGLPELLSVAALVYKDLQTSNLVTGYTASAF